MLTTLPVILTRVGKRPEEQQTKMMEEEAKKMKELGIQKDSFQPGDTDKDHENVSPAIIEFKDHSIPNNKELMTDSKLLNLAKEHKHTKKS